MTSGFIDKGRDSQEVVNLIEELRSAIMYYQVSRRYGGSTRVNTNGIDLSATINV